MIALAFFVAVALPAAIGWQLLSLAEGRRPVLLGMERGFFAVLCGTVLSMFAVFLATELLHIPLTRSGYLGVLITFFILVTTARFVWRRDATTVRPSLPWDMPRGWKGTLLLLLLLWTAVKVFAAGTTFLFLTPTFFDDSLNNWNLRGKLFYETHAIVLALPGDDPATSHLGVSSYPPTVSMEKAFAATLAGEWSEPLVNGLHLVWFLCVIGLVFCFVRRITGTAWGMVGIYILCSLPLLLMHGTNTYADAFLSGYVLSAVGLLALAATADSSERAAFLRLSALMAAALAFTKNEALLLYLPGLAAVWAGCILRYPRIERRALLKTTAIAAGIVASVLLPWLLFKWSHGLTFGNGKPLSIFHIAWEQRAPASMIAQLFFEGNWLLLFSALGVLLLWKHREILHPPLSIIAAFTLLLFFGQIPLYLFTSLSTEVVLQTGYGRGLVHLAPLATVLLTVLLARATRDVRRS